VTGKHKEHKHPRFVVNNKEKQQSAYVHLSAIVNPPLTRLFTVAL